MEVPSHLTSIIDNNLARNYNKLVCSKLTPNLRRVENGAIAAPGLLILQRQSNSYSVAPTGDLFFDRARYGVFLVMSLLLLVICIASFFLPKSLDHPFADSNKPKEGDEEKALTEELSMGME